MTKYIIGKKFSSGRATLYKNPSDQTVMSSTLDYLDYSAVQIVMGQVAKSLKKSENKFWTLRKTKFFLKTGMFY